MTRPRPDSPTPPPFEARIEEWTRAMDRAREGRTPATETYELWTQLLACTEPEVRLRAVSRARTYGAQSVPPLCGALKDPDFRVRAAAAELLGELGDQRALRPLIEALHDCFEFRSARASRLLGVGVVLGMIALFLVALLATMFAQGGTAIVDWAKGVGALWQQRCQRTDLVRVLAESIEQVGGRTTAPEMRCVLPELKSVASDLLRQSGQTRAASRRAIARIEAVTARLSALPLPAAGLSGAVDQLPGPADAPATPDLPGAPMLL